MIIKPPDDVKIYVSLSPVDMRKSINGLSALVFDTFEENPTSGDLFVFYNRGKDKVKLLHWATNGFGLYYKQLERGKFKFAKAANGKIAISHEQLDWLLAGLDFNLMAEFPEMSYSVFY